MGTGNLGSVISNFAESPALDKMQFSIQFNSYKLNLDKLN